MRRILVPHTISDDLPPDGSTVHVLQGQSMGTTWLVRLAAPRKEPGPEWRAGIQRQLDSVVAEMSHWASDSDLGRFNLAPTGSWHVLPAGFFKVLSYAMTVARDSGGAYDPFAGALVNLWGFGPGSPWDEAGFCAPSAAVVQDMLAQGRARRIELDHAGRRIRQPGGALIDLSAVAKGYGVDQVARYLEAQGIRHYLVEVGGELRGAGMKPDGQPWWVALEQPADSGNPEAGNPEDILVALHGLAVATSGDYRRYFRQDGKRYPHTIDPRTGYPIGNGVAAVAVVHAECMAADALSTALTVLGLEDGMRFAELHKLAARFVVREAHGLVGHASSAFRDMLQ
jgi:thiamine biosynthesis lipoprotein